MVGVFALLAGLTSCETRMPNDDQADLADESTGDGDDADESTGDETTTSDGDGDDVEPCSCVEIDQVCDFGGTAMNCQLPSPCTTVSGSAESAMCVLQLLAEGTRARFYYDIDGESCGLGQETSKGSFYILGPGVGIDNECHTPCGDFQSETPRANHYTIAEPSYFAGCIGESASVMTDCIFNGLSLVGPVTECGF